MVEVLGPLSARPPTPPRTSSRTLSEKDRTEDSPVVAQTPGEPPFTTSASNGAPSSRQSKRVNFSPWTKYIKPPSFANSAAKPKTDLKVLPPSNKCKPTKSILKSTNSPAPVSSPNPTFYTPDSFAMLLKSITLQLAGESTSSRLDAYMHLFGALRTYDGLPEEQEIAEYIGLLMQYIQRDISRNFDDVGPLDTNLVIQALKVSAALVWHTEISARLSDDFKIFLVDHSISSLQDSKVPKSVMTHYMSILSTQNFGSKLMTNARLSRLLTVLNELTNRVTGSSIVSQRLSIYQRILSQSKSTFVTHSTVWMEHLISGLLHHIKDIRIKAISLGFQTSMTFGPNPILSKSIRDIFDRSLDKNRKLVTEICERMARMMATAESGVHVPQVWSVVILLIRNKRLNVDQWNHFKEWVLVLQKCFNCSDSSIKAQAIVAWNRFVLVVSPGEMTSRSLLKMLSKPILSQFERKKQDKNGSQPSQLVLCSYYNLLYYAFRPSASFQHLDVVWEEYIGSPSSSIFASVSSLSDRLADVLSNMLWGRQSKVWCENKVNESNKLDPEELPTLDCRWVRSRITLILKVFENIFKLSVWDDTIEQSNIAIAWTGLSKALSYAASKEITPSPESMQVVAHVLGLLQRLWKVGPSSLNAAEGNFMDKFLERFQFLSTTMISSLGGIPFTEKLLLKTADATFQAANSPSHRHSQANSNLDSPILHFLRLISDMSGTSEPSPSYLHLINTTIKAACNGKISRGSRLELLRQCAHIHRSEMEVHIGADSFSSIVWRSTAHLAADSLCSYPIESARERDGSVSRDYENIVKILSTGLKFPGVSLEWNQLLDSFVRVVRTERSDREIATVVVEPLAESMMALRVRDTYLPSASLFNHSLSISYCHQTIEGNGANFNLYPCTSETLLFPRKLVELVSRTLKDSYQEFEPMDYSGIADFIESLTSFLGSGVLAFRSSVLESLQLPLAVWLKDGEHKLNVNNGVESRIITAGRALSSAVLNILQGTTPHDSKCLQRFEGIIHAGLESSHVSIVKRFLEFWNLTFGAQASITCPETISYALKQLGIQPKSQKPGLQLLGKVQDNTQSTSSGSRASTESCPADMSEKSRIAFILDDRFESSNLAGFISSPITRVPESLSVSLENPNESQIPSSPRTDDTPGQPNGTAQSPSLQFSIEKHQQRSDVFSMIENLRSSSPPGNTPRELGFMTPPHLRNLHNADREAETPQTPTLPPIPADNEEDFLGSSPTPGTRDRTHTGGSSLHTSLMAPAVSSQMDTDPPSSPPEVKSQSPNSENKSANTESMATRDKAAKNRRRRQKKKEKRSKGSTTSSPTKQPDAQTTPKDATENNAAAQSEQPLSSRLRSSASKMPLDPPAGTDPTQSSQAPSSSSNKESTARGASVSCHPPVEVCDSSKKQPGADYIADSSSDDMETQIASQLEQDLELAVDLDEPGEQPAEPSSQPPMTRKRKRETHETAVSTPSNYERRRSSRLSSTKDNIINDVEEARTETCSKKLTASNPTENNRSSPAESVPQKRRRHSKGAADEGEVRFAVREQCYTNRTAKATDPLDASSQKRRSTRLSGHVASVEETPVSNSPRSSRSRRQSTKQKEPTPKASQMKSVASEARTDPTAKTKLQDEVPVNVEINKVSETCESQTNAQTSEPASPSKEQLPTDSIDIQMSDAAGALIKKDPKIKITGSRSVGANSSNTDADIIPSLHQILDNVKSSTLDRRALKQIDDLLFDIRVEMHEALRRHTG